MTWVTIVTQDHVIASPVYSPYSGLTTGSRRKRDEAGGFESEIHDFAWCLLQLCSLHESEWSSSRI